jgi:hypothetical protein
MREGSSWQLVPRSSCCVHFCLVCSLRSFWLSIRWHLFSPRRAWRSSRWATCVRPRLSKCQRRTRRGPFPLTSPFHSSTVSTSPAPNNLHKSIEKRLKRHHDEYMRYLGLWRLREVILLVWFSLSAYLVTILRPGSLVSCPVHFWVGLKACKWL